MKAIIEIITRVRALSLRLAAFLLAATAATGAWAANPTATVSETSVTISNEDSSQSADNATINNMSGYCGKNFTIPAVTGLDSGTILKITSVSIAKSKTQGQGYYTPKIKLAGVPSSTAVVTTGGFTGVVADKITYSFADVDCIVKVGTATTIRFLTEEGEDSSGAFAFHLRQNAYQFIADIVWSSKAPVVEIQAEILGPEGLVNSGTTGFAPTTGAKYVLCGASGWLSTSAASTSEIVLNDGSYGFGFKINNGNSTTATGNTNGSQWSKLSGTGTLTTDAGQNSGVNGVLQIYDVSDFTGAIQTGFATGPQMSIMLRNSSETLPATLYNLVVAKNLASIYVSAGKTGDNAVTIAAGKTWKASKLVNYGELTINGTFDGLVENHGTLTVNGTINGCLLDYGTTTMNGTVTEQVRLSGASVATYSPTVREGDSIILIGEESVANAGVMPVTFPAGVDGANVDATIIRRDGGYCAAIWNGTDAYTYNSTINADIIGGANGADLDFTFTNTYARAYSAATKPGAVTLNCSEGTVAYNNTYRDKTTAMYGYAVPWTTGGDLSGWLADHSAEMTLVIVATMPSTPNAVFFHMGRDTTDSGTKRPGLLFSSGSAANEVVISYNLGNVVYPVTTMKVPNASSARHVYAVTKKDNTDTGKSVITVYLDGTKWKQLSVDTFTFSGSCGVQVGSTFGGQIISGGVDKDGNSVKAKFQKISVVGDTASSVNAIRLFGSELPEATIKKFSEPEEYPYNSPHGNSVRTFTADGSWVETESTPWANTPNGGVETAAGAPLAGSSLTVTADNANGVTVAVNLDADTTYEALTLNGDPIAFEFAEGKSGVIKATGAITIGAETTIKAGALEVGGATTILDNGVAKLIFDYSGYDASGVTVANPQTTPLVLASMDEQEEGLVTCTVPTTPHRVYSFGYANGGYNLSITAKQATLTRSGVSFDVDTFAEIFADADNYAIGDTIGINEDVTIANLAVEKNITLDLGANNLTITGLITGTGAITLTGTGTLTVPVGTTFQNITSASTKITVTGTIAKGTTLFTVGIGAYTPERVGTSTYGDVHYTLNSETGAYVVGRTYWWNNGNTSITGSYYYQPNYAANIDEASNWAVDETCTETSADVPRAFDTAIFAKAGVVVPVKGDIAYSILVEKDVTFLMFNQGDCNIGFSDTSLVQPTFTVEENGTATLSIHYNDNQYFYFYSTLCGKGTFACTCINNGSSNREPNRSGIQIFGDTSNFEGTGKMAVSAADECHSFMAVNALDNRKSVWNAYTTGAIPHRNGNASGYREYTMFRLDNSTYKFGALNANISRSWNHWSSGDDPCNKNIVLELGELRDEDSRLGNSWFGKTASYGGTVKWLAPTATFTQAATNAYNVTLAGGGNVYVEKDTTENGVSTTYIPTQLNFTDNGGYLTIDDDNAAIAADILGAINTTTAGVGLNIATTDALTIAAPSALQSGVSFNKKGTADLTLTGVTTVDTVTVAEGAGAIILPAGVTPTLGTDTLIDASYEGEGVKVVNASSLAATVSENGGAAVGYSTLASAVSVATASSASAVTITLLTASDAAVTLDAKTTLVETSTAAYSGALSGNGTFVAATLRGSAMSFSNWTGTVWLKNISSGNIVPANYGNANSTIRFTGVTGTIAQDETFTPAVELVDEGDTKALTIDCTTGYAANTATFSAIKGSGTFVTSSSNDQYPRTTFKVLDWSSFTGALNIDRGRLVFGTDTISADSWRYIYVSAGVNVTIASGKTWNATDGVVVKGTLNMPSTASMTVNKYSGDGTVNITGTPANDPSLTFSSWTGTFVLPDFTSNDKFNLTAYGTSGSWIKLNDFRPGWLKVGTLSISANLLLEGDFILTAMNGGSAFSFQTVSGPGNIRLTSSAAPASITIANLAEFTGSIANSSGASLVITKRTLAEAPSVDDCILVSSTPDNVSVEGVYVGETQQDVILEKKTDGIYVAAKKSVDSVVIAGDDEQTSVTVLDTGSNTEIDATGVSGKVAIPGTVAQITGVAAENLLLKVIYTPDGGDSTTGYYAGILTLDNSGNVSLDGSATVGGVKVQPTIGESATVMVGDEEKPAAALSGSGAPSFAIKTIPGLWYVVKESTDATTFTADEPVQATSAGTLLSADAPSSVVKYYKIAVGASKAALQ